MDINKLSPNELKQLEQQVKEKIKAEKQKKADDQAAYKALISETVRECFPILQEASDNLARVKKLVYEKFATALAMKAELYGVKDGQESHTFTDLDSQMRIVLGYNTVDEYDDTADTGAAMVKEVLESLRIDGDPKSETSVNINLDLLAKDKKGAFKLSKVMTLRKRALESKIDRFIEGVEIIMSAHRSVFTKQYIKAEKRDELNKWTNLPLGITEAE